MAAHDVPIEPLASRAEACAAQLWEADAVLLVSHIDADGLTSAGIAAQALERASIPFSVQFEKQLDSQAIAAIARKDVETVLFTDFGSGQIEEILTHEGAGEFTPIIVDHHQPGDGDTRYHLNPLLEGINGAAELSGAGASYLLARGLDQFADTDNRDLAALAVVGAVGDMQAVNGELQGANQEIVAEGIGADHLRETTDIAIFGKQTRPIPKLLEYATDVEIPGISNDERGVLQFLDELDLELHTDDRWKRWVELTETERQTLVSALVQRAVSRGVPAKRIEQIVGTTYILTAEPVGTELRDANEFSTLLNATARYDRADVGLAVCLGNRNEALDRARELLYNHRRNLSEGIEWVETTGVTRESNLQWFDAGDAIRETIVGIIAGMAMGLRNVDRDIPIIAFAAKNESETKVSGRGTGSLVRQGLDLSAVMTTAAQAVGGDGGGHDIAAGATIPTGEQAAFIDTADEIIGEQLGQT